MAMAVSGERVNGDVLNAPDQPSLPALKEGAADGPAAHSQHNQQVPGTLLQRALARIMPGQQMQQHSHMQATAEEPLSGMLSLAAAAAAAAACCGSGQQPALPSFADQRELQLVAAAFAAGAAAGASGQFNGTIPLLEQLSSEGTSQTSSLAADGSGDTLPAAAAATSAEPNHSKLKPSANKRGDAFKSSFRGVFWDRKNSRWRAQVGYQNRKIFMGYFAEPADAARAYDKKLVQLRGTMAKTNFPLQDYAADLRLHKELRAAEDGDELLLLPLEELQAHLQQHLQERVPQQPALQKVYSDWSRRKAQTEALSLCARERLQLQQSGLAGGPLIGDQAGVIGQQQQQQQGRVRPFEQPQHQQQHLQSLQQHWGADAAAAADADAASAPGLLGARGSVEQVQGRGVGAGGTAPSQAAGGAVQAVEAADTTAAHQPAAVQLPSTLELQWSTSLPVQQQQQQQPRLRQQRGQQAALTSQQQQEDDPMEVGPILPAAPHVSQADVRPEAPQQLQLQQHSRQASPTTPGGSSRSSAAAPGGSSSSSGVHRQQREAPKSLQQHLLTRLHEQRVQRTSSGSSMEALLAAAAALQEEEEVAATLCGQLHELVSSTAGPLGALQQQLLLQPPCSRGDCVPLLAAAAAAAAACGAEVSTAPAGRQAASHRVGCQASGDQKVLRAPAATAAAASSGGSLGRGGGGSSGQEEASVGLTCLQKACGSHSQHSVVVTDTAAVVAAILTSPTALQQQKHHSGSVWQHRQQQATGAQQQQHQEADSKATEAQQQQDTTAATAAAAAAAAVPGTIGHAGAVAAAPQAVPGGLTGASGQQQGNTAGPAHTEQQTREAEAAPASSSGKTATLQAASAAAAGTAVSDGSQLCMAAAAAAAVKPGSSEEQQPQQVVFDTEQEERGQLSPLGVLHRQMLQVPTTEQQVIYTIQMAHRAGLNKEGQQLLLLVMYHQLLDLQKEQQQQQQSAQNSKQLQVSRPQPVREQQPAKQQQGDEAADYERGQQGLQQQQALPAEGCVMGDRMSKQQQMGPTGCRQKIAQQLTQQDNLTLGQGPQDQQQQQQGPRLGGDRRAGGTWAAISPTAGCTMAAGDCPGQQALKPRTRTYTQFEALQRPIPEINGGKDANYEQRGGAQDVSQQLERPAKQRHLDNGSSAVATKAGKNAASAATAAASLATGTAGEGTVRPEALPGQQQQRPQSCSLTAAPGLLVLHAVMTGDE